MRILRECRRAWLVHAGAVVIALAAAGHATSWAHADAPLSAAAIGKIVDNGTNWTAGLSGGKLPVIVEFAMPAVPDLPAGASESDRDKAHTAVVRGAQERILARALGVSGASSVAAAESSPDTNLKLMSFSPQFAINASAADIEKFAADPTVVRIHEDVAQPPLLDQSVPLIGMPNAYTAGATGNNFRVAILDTGGRRAHEFLSSRITHEACYNTTNSVATSRCPGGAGSATGTGSGEDCDQTPIYGCGHGTHVAGTAAGFNTNRQAGEPAHGVARDGRIVSINVFSRFVASQCGTLNSPYTGCLLSYQSDQIRALEYVNTNRTSLAIAAVNMSLGGGRFYSACDSEPQAAIINTLRANNVAVVIAAGNSGYPDSVGSPGCISAAITVANTTKSDALASSSNWGTLIDVAAPGSSINASYTNNGNIGYGSLTGTSMAAPHVAGAFAAIRTRLPNATVTQIETALENTGVGISFSGVTKPRIRVDHALNNLLGTPQPVTNDNFANRVAITPSSTTGGSVTVTGNNAGFTKESGEPNHVYSSATTSAWWRFTPTVSGSVTINTANSTFDTVLGVYTGSSVSGLTTVVQNDDVGGTLQSQVQFTATAGVQYQIAVAGYNGASGAISLTAIGGGGTVQTTRIVASVVPVARTVQVGNGPNGQPRFITAGVSVTNAGSANAVGCTISKPSDGLPYTLIYARRLPPNFDTLGPTNEAFDLAPGDANAKHFLIVVTPSAVMSANIPIVYDCANTDPAPVTIGVNTLQLTATASPTPDMIVGVGTPNDGGILTVPNGGGRVIAMAAINNGQPGTLTARLSTTPFGGSTVNLPLTLGLCETNPSTGQCLNPASTLPISFTALSNVANTFTAFITHNGAPIPLNPGVNRVYLQVLSGSTPMGAASIAVQTTSGASAAVASD